MRTLSGIVIGAAILLYTTIPLDAQSLKNDESATTDAVMVAQTIALALEGKYHTTNNASVRFADANAAPPANPIIQYEQFHLISSALIPYDQKGGNRNRRIMAGLLLHQDAIGRLISTAFEVDYRRYPDGSMVIDTAVVTERDASVPDVLIGFVPAKKVRPSLLNSRNFVDLFKFVEKNAEPRIQCRKSTRAEKDYLIFAFYMDRAASNARVRLVISDHPEGLSGSGEGTTTFQDNGWHVAYAPAKFAMDGSPEIFFKALYKPGGRVSKKEQKEIAAGVFSSDSVTKQVQRLLAHRGYDPGPADGLPGKRTKRAIREFQKDQGIETNGELTPGLVAVLAGDGQLSQAKPIKTDAAGSRNGTPDRLKSKMWMNHIKQFD